VAIATTEHNLSFDFGIDHAGQQIKYYC